MYRFINDVILNRFITKTYLLIDINGKIEQWHEPRHRRHERQLNVKQVKPEAESKVKAQKAKEEASKRKKEEAKQKVSNRRKDFRPRSKTKILRSRDFALRFHFKTRVLEISF